MQFRSSNSKFTHFQGDVLSNIDDSSHGVHLTGGSTGGIVQPAGDDDNIALTVRGKGTGAVRLGNSSQTLVSTGITSTHVNLNSTKVSIGGSTTYFQTIRRVRIDFTVPELAANGAAVHGSSIALANLTTNAVIVVQPRTPLNSSVAGVHVQARCSTAGALHLTFMNGGGTTLSGSTMSAYALIFENNVPAA